MATKLLYLADFDVVGTQAKVESIDKAEDGRTVIVLDETCFYPRGGGQDWDTGMIDGVFTVDEVRLDADGVVHHLGEFTGPPFKAGAEVECEVDTKRRTDNTRLHSAGHLIDMAMHHLRPDWIPEKGAHYSYMSFVEYQVPPDTTTDEAFRIELENQLTELSQSAYRNQIKFVDKKEMHKYCRHVPDNLPTNKPSRIVLYAEDFGIPCGGTHVEQVGQIGKINIPKIKVKKGVAKVSYTVEGIN